MTTCSAANSTSNVHHVCCLRSLTPWIQQQHYLPAKAHKVSLLYTKSRANQRCMYVHASLNSSDVPIHRGGLVSLAVHNVCDITVTRATSECRTPGQTCNTPYKTATTAVPISTQLLTRLSQKFFWLKTMCTARWTVYGGKSFRLPNLAGQRYALFSYISHTLSVQHFKCLQVQVLVGPNQDRQVHLH